MKLILAIEPETAQARVLQCTVPDRVGVEFIVVKSAAAAVLEINKRVPDVLLIGRSISAADQEVIVEHVKSSGDRSEVLTIPIPELQVTQPEPKRSRFGLRKKKSASEPPTAWDPFLFVEQIGRSLVEAEKRAAASVQEEEAAEVVETPAEPLWIAEPAAPGFVAAADAVTDAAVIEQAPASIPPADALGSTIEQMQKQAEARLAEEIDRLRAEAAVERATHLDALEREAAASREATVKEARAIAEASAREALSAELASMRLEAADVWSTGLAEARSEAETRLASEIARVRAEAERAIEQTAGETLNAEIERARAEAATRLECELDQLRGEAKQVRLDRQHVRQEADSVLDRTAREARAAAEEIAARQLQGEIRRLRAESQARLEAELARFRDDADQARLEREQAHHEAAALREEAVRQALAVAEAGARDAWSAELERARTDAEQKLVSELARVRADAERTLEQATAQTLKTEIERARAEAVSRLEQELDQVRRESALERLAHEQAEREAAAARDEGVRRALADAEERARAAWAVELAQARTDAEEKLVAELGRVRADAERTLEQATAHTLKHEVDRVRAEAAARLEAQLDEMRAEAERARQVQEQALQQSASIREHAAREAREAAEAAAARQLQEEIAGVRAESHARLEAELARFREDADQARSARDEARLQAETEAESLRASIERQARSTAEAAAARALEAEVARVKADAEARLEKVLVVLRRSAEQAQAEQQQHKLAMERIREQSLQEARAFADAIAVELAQARERGPRIHPAAMPVPEPEAVVYQKPPASRTRHLALAFATVVVLVGVAGALSAPLSVETTASGLIDKTTTGLIDKVRLLGSFVPAQAVQAEPVSTPASSPPPRVLRRATPPPAEASPVAALGLITVSAGIPLDLYSGQDRIGSSGDGQLQVASGQQTIGVVSERFNFRGELAVDVQPGEATSHTVSLPVSPVRVQTAPGAEVWIDNQLLGTAPLAPADMPIGTHDVVVKHPDFGERRQSVDVKFGEPTELALELAPQP